MATLMLLEIPGLVYKIFKGQLRILSKRSKISRGSCPTHPTSLKRDSWKSSKPDLPLPSMNNVHLNENHEKLCLNLPFVYYFNSFNCCFASLVALSKLPSPPCLDFIFRRGSFFVKILSAENRKRQIPKNPVYLSLLPIPIVLLSVS